LDSNSDSSNEERDTKMPSLHSTLSTTILDDNEENDIDSKDDAQKSEDIIKSSDFGHQSLEL